ncbi:hypothetical protein [Haloarcula sp. H-GB5]
MTTNMDTEAIREAKQNDRDGEPRADRPEAVDKFLAPEEAVGFDEGLPLLDKEYADYCESVLAPEAHADVWAVSQHGMVTSVEDVAAELDTTVGKVRKALTIHDIEEPKGDGSFDVPAVEQEGYIEVPLCGAVDTTHLRSPLYEDARLLEHLYVRCGLGVAEIKAVLEDGMNTGRSSEKSRYRVTEQQIHAALEDVSLIKAEDETSDRREDDVKLGGATHDFSETASDRGLVVNANNY